MSRRCKQLGAPCWLFGKARNERFGSDDWRQGMGVMLALMWLVTQGANDMYRERVL